MDLFPGYDSRYITTSPGAKLFVRISHNKESKPPLLMLHGFPQTHVEFHKIAPLLLPHFTLIALDLRGYGASFSPESTNGSAYSKRIMGKDSLSVMQQLGYEKFSILGHDRGARVAYRMAFDMPEHLDKIIVVDIVPTASMFQGLGNIENGLRAYHWLFLAQPEPFPERLILGSEHGKAFLEHTLASWTAERTLESFDAVALEKYGQAYCTEERVHTTCEDYRAGALIDTTHDEEDLAQGRKFKTPTLAVWGERGLFAEGMKKLGKNPLDEWKIYAENVQGQGLPCGHFVTEEDPEGLAKIVLSFLL